ncbi:arginine--tRNA ligase [Telmatocola sphagniphila]|uniref:Arginine--tRNA ligase n=1 Tax=Telmatocola sphagniphila TaxID=1123043 RepID=A0A8E6B7Q7_9BACT|nr:arginine--tRNA ligase [Telmatocola sphagniphila]QVL32897.1 arginine--tRNA ligase [Telmatocola sphagniphila]
MNLIEQLRSVFRPILAKRVEDESKLLGYLGMIRPGQNPDLADYQANFAMPLAKTLNKKSPELASEIISELPKDGLIASANLAGPGFINLKLSDAFLAQALSQIRSDDRLGASRASSPRKIVIDYSGPNVAKPLHVGHLRSTIIGEALHRLLEFRGHQVIADNHLGDWGTQFGMLLYGYKNHLDKAAYEKDPVSELARLYKLVRKLGEAKSDEDEGDTANPVVQAYRQETVKLHQGDPENNRLWKEFMPACLEEVHIIYRRLDVHFDHELGESFYNPMLADVVADCLKKGIAQESQGAIVIAENEKSVSLIRKSDGAYTYTTTDLATIKYRVEHFRADCCLYVVDFRQGDHFKKLFTAAKRWGYPNIELTHVSFGSVLGEDKRPIKTRSGEPIELNELLDEAIRQGREKYEASRSEREERGFRVPELSDAEIQEIAEVVGLGAVKYADLSQNRTSDYVFSYEKMLATDGNTATYNQYAYARCRSIFRESEVEELAFQKQNHPVILGEPQERALALQLLRLDEALITAEAEYAPHALTSYLWEVSKALASFYASPNCSVLKASSDELKNSRLVLCDLTARTISLVLNLLAIRTVERM